MTTNFHLRRALNVLAVSLIAIVAAHGLPKDVKYEKVSHPPNLGPGHRLPLYIENFRLKSVTVQESSARPDSDGYAHKVTHHVVPNELFQSQAQTPNQHERRRLADSTERERVQLMLKLSLAIYPISEYYNTAGFELVFENGDGRVGGSDSTVEAAANYELWQSVTSELYERGEWSSSINPSFQATTNPYSTCGSVLGLFEEENTGDIVLVFRGATTACDTANVGLHYGDWIKKRFQKVYTQTWKDQGLRVTNEMKALAQEDDVYYQGYFDGLGLKMLSDVTSYLSTLGADTTTIAQTGYWELTKAIVREVALPEDAGGVYITGHSMGGMTAQLVSMWLEQEDGMAYPTYTFGAPGTQCVARDTFYDGNYLDDLNPYSYHPNITNYVHALDPYGNMDYDAGVGCTFGTNKLKKSKAAEYCASIVGVSGAKLFISPYFEALSSLKEQLNACTYFTHNIFAYVDSLMQEGALDDDGIPDGGCSAVEVISQSDPDKMCPKEEKETVRSRLRK